MLPVVAVSGWAHAADALKPCLQGRGAAPSVEFWSLDEFLAGGAEFAVPTILVGWSAGGIAVLAGIAGGMRNVAGVVLLSATARFCAGEGYACGVPSANLRAMIVGLRRRPADVLRRFFADSAFPASLDESLIDHKTQYACNKIGLDKLHHGLVYLRDTDLRERLGKMTMPMLVIHGKHDRIIPMASAEFLAERLGDARLVSLNEVGHAIPEQAPDRTACAVSRFVEWVS